MGRGIIESGLFRSEQYGVEQRTSDPSEHKEGERWIRTDLAPDTDQIATYRFDMGTEVVDIPIFDESATTENVEKVRRVQVGGQTGFIPFTSSGPAYPEWAFQHNGSRLGAHDALTASAIPDSGGLQARYDATELSLSDGNSVSTWTDETGSGFDLTAGAAPTFRTSIINGNPAVRHDGTDDYLNVGWSSIPQPFHVFIVASKQTAGNTSSENLIDGGTNDEHLLRSENDGPFWNMFAGSDLDDNSDDTNNNIFAALFNGSSSTLRINGTQVANGNAGGNSSTGLTTGARNGGGAGFGDFDIGEILFYPQDKSSVQSDVESYLSDKWGISL